MKPKDRIEINRVKDKFKVTFRSATGSNATIEYDYLTRGGAYKGIISHYITLFKIAGISIKEANKHPYNHEIRIVTDRLINIPVFDNTLKVIKQEPILKQQSPTEAEPVA